MPTPDPDLSLEEALKIARSRLGAVIVEESGWFIVCTLPSDSPAPRSPDSATPTQRVKRKELGRGRTRREALAAAGVK
jgi:hypothetical protein